MSGTLAPISAGSMVNGTLQPGQTDLYGPLAVPGSGVFDFTLETYDEWIVKTTVS